MSEIDKTDFLTIAGACHCGNIRFAFGWPGAAEVIPVRACGCGFCRKHGGVWTSHPHGSLTVRIAEPAKVAPYRFGTATADFHVCGQCGVVPVVTSEIGGILYGIVNTNCFEDLGDIRLEESPMDFEGEASDDRLARRCRNWIASVTLASGIS